MAILNMQPNTESDTEKTAGLQASYIFQITMPAVTRLFHSTHCFPGKPKQCNGLQK